MALPAGRYGVTKRQLNKVKNLPMDTIGMIEEAIQGQEQLLEDTVGFIGQNYIKPTQGDVTTSGVTFSLNSDNSVTIMDGPTTGGCVYLFDSAFTCKANKKYRLTGCPSGGGTESSNYWVGAYIDSNITDERKDTGSGCVFSFNVDTVINIRLRLPSGFTPPANFTFYPMLTDAKILNPTYVPNHPSVDESKCDNSVIAPVEDQATCQNPNGYAVGEHFIRNGAFCTVTQVISSGSTLTEGTNYTSGDVADDLFIRGILNSSNNLNNVRKTGLYTIQTPPVNSPENVGYCGMIVHKAQSEGHLRQMVFKTTEREGYIYIRSYSGNPLTWNPWFKFTGTMIS